MSWMRELPPETLAALKTETRGEIIRWAGRPDARRAFRKAFGVYAFAIPWCAITFTVFGVLVAATLFGKPPARAIPPWEYWAMAAALIFSFAFVAAGMAMLATPFWVRYHARRTVHAITDKRLVTLIVTPRKKTVASVLPDAIIKTTRTEHRTGNGTGTGTLRIVTGYDKDSDGDTVEQATELFAVPHVAAATRALDDLRRAPDRPQDR